jgi:hypothetical protein
MMLTTLGASPLSGAMATSGARCSTFACTSSWMARAYSFGNFLGELTGLLLYQIDGELHRVSIDPRLSISVSAGPFDCLGIEAPGTLSGASFYVEPYLDRAYPPQGPWSPMRVSVRSPGCPQLPGLHFYSPFGFSFL